MRSIQAEISASDSAISIHPLLPVYGSEIPDSASLNPRLEAAFLSLREDPSTRRSHWFNGRYENIYPQRQRIPEIESLIRQVETAASAILHCSMPLRTGFWFNQMEPGDVTTLHNHDEDDELLSAVYYLKVPANSGRLVFSSTQASLQITPQPGLLLLFPPSLPHEVEAHQGEGTRLSVAFNTGPAG